MRDLSLKGQKNLNKAINLYIVVYINALSSDGILEPSKILYSEKITEGQIKHYELLNMHSNVLYDVRISYPAYVRQLFEFFFLLIWCVQTPADFTMKIFKQDSTGRQLLNIESVKFRTDNQGNIEVRSNSTCNRFP